MCKYLIACLGWLRLLIDNLIDMLFYPIFNGRKQKIPDLEKKHSILTLSAVEMAKRIRSKELKSEELVKAVIERIKQVDPLLNAIVDERYEAALSEARDIDSLIENGLSDEIFKKKPFLGVPFTTKECQPVKGFSMTLGLWSRRGLKSDEDSAAIKLLKESGAIPLAATNLPELLIWQETRNMVYGQTNNPHHLGRTTGGSSGAEAALTATYATPISLCSDIGGSTRMPAFYCGMFGHHPTANVTNTQGVLFRKGDEESMLSLGFISKCVEDLAPLIQVIAGPKAPLLKLDRQVDIKDIKFYYVESSDDCLVSKIKPELRDAMNRVISNLSSKATSTSDAPEPYCHSGLSHMYKLWRYWMLQEPEKFAHIYTDRKGEAHWYTELFKKLFCMSHHCMSSVMQVAELQLLTHIDSEWATKLTQELKDDLFSKLGDNGVLLFPSAPTAAPFHYVPLVKPWNFSYWALVNVLKCPATQVPLGVNGNGMPIGIQVVAAPYNDALCLTVAKYLEKEFGGAIMACQKA